MSFGDLRAALPKKTVKWSIADVRPWLKIIGLENLYERFGKGLVMQSGTSLMAAA